MASSSKSGDRVDRPPVRKLMRYARQSATDDLHSATDDLHSVTDGLRSSTDGLHLNVDKNFAEFVVLERFV